MGILIAILIFGMIIFVHELGHFAVAKFNKIKVHEFSMGLGPTIVSKEIKGTVFSLKALPFGGSCVMGEDNVDDVEFGSFNSKSVWRRISVIFAGAFMNFLTAFILCVIIAAWVGFIPPVVGDTIEGFSAKEQGILPGDEITRLDNRRIRTWSDISFFNMENMEGNPINVTFKRGEETHTVLITPRAAGEDGEGPFLIGIRPKEERINPGVMGSLEHGFYNFQFWFTYIFRTLQMLFSGEVGIDGFAGPLGIVNVMDEVYQASVEISIAAAVMSLINITILISINVGIINLLPLPALDGGRLVFLFFEAIRGKRVPLEKEGMVHFIGIVVLLTFMVFLLFNDARNIFGG